MSISKFDVEESAVARRLRALAGRTIRSAPQSLNRAAQNRAASEKQRAAVV